MTSDSNEQASAMFFFLVFCPALGLLQHFDFWTLWSPSAKCATDSRRTPNFCKREPQKSNRTRSQKPSLYVTSPHRNSHDFGPASVEMVNSLSLFSVFVLFCGTSTQIGQYNSRPVSCIMTDWQKNVRAHWQCKSRLFLTNNATSNCSFLSCRASCAPLQFSLDIYFPSLSKHELVLHTVHLIGPTSLKLGPFALLSSALWCHIPGPQYCCYLNRQHNHSWPPSGRIDGKVPAHLRSWLGETLPVIAGPLWNIDPNHFSCAYGVYNTPVHIYSMN